MGIADDDIGRVRQASDIVAIVSEHVQLKRVGRRWQGLCPFHAEKSGSFSVNQEEGLYYCFGCGAKGDVITFVREIEHLDFPGAVEKLAARAGIALTYTDRDEGEGRKRRNRLYDAVEQAVEWYHQRLLSSPDAAKARGYLRSRGLSGDEVRAYRIGWAPEAWDELATALRLPLDVWEDSGLGRKGNRGGQYDTFRGRVLFPIFDASGRAVGFGGRKLPDADDSKIVNNVNAKYVNSVDSSIYTKSKLLYGLNWSKGDIVNANQAIVCEGYTDVIGFATVGVPRAVATCGTALTEEHVRILRSFADRVVLAFDADAAGQNAAAKFYEWERKLDLEVWVADLPAGVDPGDLSRSDPERLRAAVEGAVPFLGFRVNRVLDAGDLSRPEGRARTAEAALAVIAEHPSDLVRDQYVMEVASRCRIEPDRLRAGVASVGRRAPVGKAVRVDTATRRSADLQDSPEVSALRLLLQQPDDIGPWLDESLFFDDRIRSAYRAVREAESVRDALDQTDPAAADLLHRLAAEQTEADVIDVVSRLLEESSRRRLRDLESQVGLGDSVDFARVAADIGWVKVRLEELREPATNLNAAEQLLAWLARTTEEDT